MTAFTAADFTTLDECAITETEDGIEASRRYAKKGERAFGAVPKECKLMARYNDAKWRGYPAGSWRCYQVDVAGGKVTAHVKLVPMRDPHRLCPLNAAITSART